MPQAQGIRIGRILGIPIYIDLSWIIIFGLITYLISNQFAQLNPQWTITQLGILGAATSLLFFGSVLIRVLSITLFLFGGLARIGKEPSKAIQEFNIAIAGPLASAFLAGVFFLSTLLFPDSKIVAAVSTYLWQTNLALAVFNMLPGFPWTAGGFFAPSFGERRKILCAPRGWREPVGN